MSPLATLATTATITTMGSRPATPAEIEARLDAGAWLLPGEVAILYGVDRSTIIRGYLLPDPPVIRYRYRAGSGRYRELHPHDVRVELNKLREVHG